MSLCPLQHGFSLFYILRLRGNPLLIMGSDIFIRTRSLRLKRGEHNGATYPTRAQLHFIFMTVAPPQPDE